LVTVQDLTSARELETKTERLQKLATVGTLSAGVAHEIKNALVAIKSFAELLLERQPDSEAATLVRREVGRIDTLVSQLLRFAGPARPSFGTVRVHDLLQNGLRLVRHTLKIRQIEEVLLLEAVNDRVNGDAKQLEQAFLNLLLNAVEAMGDRGRLVIRTEIVVATEHISKFEPQKREPQIQVEIRDTGPGIPPELMPRLFTPFMTTKPDGTGLGLVITRRIVQEHHGTIAIESRPAQGATFRILLPLVKPVP
jgi:signal transduction histidine kinase